MKNQVRTVFLGDAHCGKTSIINTINTNEFQEGLPDISEEVTIPDEFTISHVPLYLDDSSLPSEESMERTELIHLADAIVVVVDASNEDSYDSIFLNWMPSILKVSSSKPVIVVANKVDLLEGEGHEEQNTKLEQMLGRVLSEYMSVEVCLKCSAKTAMNLDKILYYAEKSVIFPVAPLYDRATHTLSDPVKCILRRIFRVFNRSRTLSLSDAELNDFQFTCFNTRMTPAEIANLKGLLQQQGGATCLDASTKGITEEGFLHLMKLFVMKDHTETVWTALRHFQYDDDLTCATELPTFSLSVGQSVEFTPEARVFLTSLFKAYDAGKTGVLTREGLFEVFASLPSMRPLWETLAGERNEYMHPICPLNCLSNENNDITLSGWLCEWMLMLRIAPRETLEAIVQLGYAEDPALLFMVTKEKTEDWDKYQILRRNVVHAFLFGQSGVGKTTILRRLLRAPQSAMHIPTEQLSTVVAPVKPRTQKSEEKVVMMTEVPETCEEHALSECMEMCDIACMVFDASSAESFEYVKRLQQKLPVGMKVLYIANKSDKAKMYETTELCRTAADYLNNCGLELPLLTRSDMKDRLFPVIFDCAVYPDICVPKCEALQTRKGSFFWRFTTLAMVLGLIGISVWV